MKKANAFAKTAKMSNYTPPHLRPPTGMEYPEGILPQVGKYQFTPNVLPDPVVTVRAPLTYLASPYSHPNEATRAMRYVKAVEATAWLIKRLKWNVFSPITHSHPLATLGNLSGDWPFWESIDRQYIDCSERLVVLEIEGWRESKGVTAEIEIARKQGIEVIWMAPRGKGYELQPFPLDEKARSAEDQLKACLKEETDKEPKFIPPSLKEMIDKHWANQDTEPLNPKIPPQSRAETANPKDLVGSTKISLSKIPPVALAHEAHAMMDGAKKYMPYNWRAKPVTASIYVDAAMRHLLDWFEGEEDAPDSRAHHLGHCRACCGILLDAQETGCLLDDRPVTTKSKGIMTRVLERLRAKL